MADDVDARSLLPARTPSPPASPPASPPPPPAAVSADDTVMSLVEHLTELRRRILRVILAVAAGSVVGFLVAEPVRDSVVRLLPSQQVQVLGPGDAFSITVRIAVVIGIVLAMPVI